MPSGGCVRQSGRLRPDPASTASSVRFAESTRTAQQEIGWSECSAASSVHAFWLRELPLAFRAAQWMQPLVSNYSPRQRQRSESETDFRRAAPAACHSVSRSPATAPPTTYERKLLSRLARHFRHPKHVIL